MRLSVVIPAFNEAQRLPATLAAVLAFLQRADQPSEVIVVDDGSTDGTADVCRQTTSSADLRVLRRALNGGKGAAVRDGLREARGRHVLLMDADGSTRIEEVELLMAVAVEHEVPVVIGSRYVAPECVKIRQPWYRIAVSRAGNRLIRATVLPGITDTQCGFKLIEASAARMLAAQLTRDGFSYDVELLVLAQRRGLRVREVAVSWYDDPGTKLRPVRACATLLRDLRWIAVRYGTARHPRACSPAPPPAASPTLPLTPQMAARDA